MATKRAKLRTKDPTDLADTRGKPAPTPAPARTKLSDAERFRLIQARAYNLWEQAGRPDGDANRERFWLEAERQFHSSEAAGR